MKCFDHVYDLPTHDNRGQAMRPVESARRAILSTAAKIAGTSRNMLARLPLPLLQRSTGHAPCLVLYHAVTDESPEHLRHLIPCRGIAAFRRDLDILLKYFQPVTLAQLTAWAVHAQPLPRDAFHLTCDDGLREAAEVIAPICREKGVPATFFLTTGFLDNRLLGDRHLASLLLARIGCMSDAALCALRTEIECRYPEYVSPGASWKELLLAKQLSSSLLKKGDRHLATTSLSEIFDCCSEPVPVFQQAASATDDTSPPGGLRRPLASTHSSADAPGRTRQRALLDTVAQLVGLDQAAYLRIVRPYIERHEVTRLLADGFTIGAHTVDHPYFPAITHEEQVRQTVESVRRIEADFGIPCHTFAFPFGADGVQPEYYESVRAVTEVDLFFGVGVAGPLPSNRAGGYRLLDRIPLDYSSDVPAEMVLRRAYATRLEHRVRGIRTDSNQNGSNHE